MAKPRNRKPRDGDSPITVGGGGGKRTKTSDPDEIRVKFNHNKYVQNGDFWSNPDLELVSLELNSKDIDVTKRTGIVITYDRGTQHDNIIRINEGRMGVRFFQDHFPYDADPGQEQHHGRGQITALRIGAQDIDPLPSTVKIVAHTTLKRRATKRNKKR